MNVSTENIYLYNNYNMPPLYDWNPNTKTKAKQQNYFKGVFLDATNKHH
jgi:hypothetical protein